MNCPCKILRPGGKSVPCGCLTQWHPLTRPHSRTFRPSTKAQFRLFPHCLLESLPDLVQSPVAGYSSSPITYEPFVPASQCATRACEERLPRIGWTKTSWFASHGFFVTSRAPWQLTLIVEVSSNAPVAGSESFTNILRGMRVSARRGRGELTRVFPYIQIFRGRSSRAV